MELRALAGVKRNRLGTVSSRGVMNPGSPSTPVRLFGTNGIREVVGEKLTAEFVTSVTGAIAQTVPIGPPIAVGWDGRTSSTAFARTVSSTLALGGHGVIELGILPTPAIQFNVPALKAQFGVIVTASHNPPEYNGIKLIAADGLEIPRRVEEAIELLVESHAAQRMPFDRIGEVRLDGGGASRYVERILQLVDQAAIQRRRFTIVLDCGNGTSVYTSPTLLRLLGCRVITLNAQVDGTFPGHLSEPTEANVADLRHTVPAVGADLGVVHDGDADRAVFVDSRGRYVPGEKTLTLLAREIVEAHHGGVVVTPVSASQSVEDAIRPLGGEVVYTKVGSPVVTREMQSRRAVFGGEENGGLIFPQFQLARDGAMTLASVLEVLARNERTLEDLLKDLPDYVLVKEKIACPIEAREKVLAFLVEEQRTKGGRFLTLDGLKIFEDAGWILLRPSGTESLMRVFAEAKTVDDAQQLARTGIARVKAALQILGVATN